MAREILDLRLDELREQRSKWRAEHPDAEPIGFTIPPNIRSLRLDELSQNAEYLKYIFLGHYYNLPTTVIAAEFGTIPVVVDNDRLRLLKTLEENNPFDVLERLKIDFAAPKEA